MRDALLRQGRPTSDPDAPTAPTAPPGSRVLAAWRYATLMLTALTLGLAFAHALELPVKVGYDSSLYVQVNHTLYRYFALAGGPIEVSALAAAGVLAFLVRGRRPAFVPTLAAAVCLAAALAVFFAVIQPANVEFGDWTPTSVPADWTAWRNRWEYGHAAHAGLQFAALSLLVVSLLRDIRAGGGAGPGGPGRPVRRAS